MSEKRNRSPVKRKSSSSEPVFDILKITLRHKSLVSLGVVIGAVLGAIYFAKATPVYQSSTDVLIVNKRPDAVAGMQSYFNDYMSTHGALIVSPVIVERAIEKSGLASLRSFADVPSAGALTGTIINQLKVETGSSRLGKGADNILTLSFLGAVPEECPIVVNAILDSYKAFLSETYDNMSTDTVELMVEARDVLLLDLKQQEQAYRKFRQESPLMTTNDGGANPVHTRLSTIQSQRSSLLMRRTELESQLASIQNAMASGRDADYLNVLVSNLGLGLEILQIQNENRSEMENLALRVEREKQSLSEKLETMLLPLVQQEKELLQQYGPNHPLVASLRLRIKETRNYFQKLEGHAVTTEDGDELQNNNVQLCVEYLQQELERIATSQQLLTTLYDAEYEVAKELTTFQLTEGEFQRNMARTQQLYDGIINQLQDANLSRDFGGFKADVISPAGFGYKVKPDAKIVAPMSIFFGILLGVLLAYGADMADRTFRSPEEIATGLGLPLVGHIRQSVPFSSSALAPELAKMPLDRSLCTFYWPMSAEAEAYRGLRTGLYFSNRGKNHNVIQVTSPCPGDGKSTVAANLSVCIAQSGKRVLLIDADMRKPRQHLIFDRESDNGLSTVIALDEELKDATCETPIDNLWLLPAGPLPPDPAELLTSSRFGELISVVREQYDYVVVDTGPLLVSDPCIVASQVDGLLLTTRMARTPRKEAERAKDVLASLDAPVLGVVVNGVGSSHGYGYASYGYGHYGSYRQGRNGTKQPKRLPAKTTVRS